MIALSELCDRLIVILRTFFDDSSDGQSAMFVSGWIASADSWVRFERDWGQLLAAFGLRYFHMKELFAFRGQYSVFQGDNGTLARLLESAVKIIKAHVRRGIACGVSVDEYQSVNLEFPISSKIGNPYAICCLHAALLARKWGRNAGFGGEDIRYHFDDPGPRKGKDKAILLFDDFNLTSPIFENGEKDKKPAGLQAADFMAWEHRRLLQDASAGTVSNIRRSLRHLNSIPNEAPVYGKSALLHLCEKFKLKATLSGSAS